MSVLLSLVAMAATAGALGVTAGVRWLIRRDHRCTVRTRTSGCLACAQVLRGQARGGHMVCACGASSPHLTGVDLLHWRVQHVGDRFAALPGGSHRPGAGSGGKPASTTRVRAAQEAEATAFVAMMDELGEAERRAIARARRNPDPITPQLLREAERRSRSRDTQTADTTDAGYVDGETGTVEPDEF